MDVPPCVVYYMYENDEESQSSREQGRADGKQVPCPPRQEGQGELSA